MAKLLLFILLALAVYLVWRKGRSLPPVDAGRPRAESESMVSCAYCQLYLPRAESIDRQGRHYCCREHEHLDAGRSPR